MPATSTFLLIIFSPFYYYTYKITKEEKKLHLKINDSFEIIESRGLSIVSIISFSHNCCGEATACYLLINVGEYNFGKCRLK
jgi:hypothetical protein